METKETKMFNVKGSNGKEYEVTLKFLLESKQIYFIDCTCPNFTGIVVGKDGKLKYIGRRRIKQHNGFSDAIYYAEPCKHLKPIIEMYERDFGFIMKKPKEMEGTDHPTAELKRILLERSRGMCEGCGLNKAENIHRKIRGSNGGKYNEWNCIFLCGDCHKLVHGKEEGHGSA